MKYLDVDLKLFKTMSVYDFIQMIKSIHPTVEWVLMEDENILFTSVLEKDWYYEYCLYYESLDQINCTICKNDDAMISSTCRLDFLVTLMQEGYTHFFENSDLYETCQLYEDITNLKQELEVLFETHRSAQENIKVPLLFKPNMDEYYEYEIHDLLIYLLEERLKQLKSCRRFDEEYALIEEILQFNCYLGERKQTLDKIKQILLSHFTKKGLNDLKKEGIYLHHNKHTFCTFFGNHRYYLVLSSSPSCKNAGNQAYRDIKKYFF